MTREWNKFCSWGFFTNSRGVFVAPLVLVPIPISVCNHLVTYPWPMEHNVYYEEEIKWECSTIIPTYVWMWRTILLSWKTHGHNLGSNYCCTTVLPYLCLKSSYFSGDYVTVAKDLRSSICKERLEFLLVKSCNMETDYLAYQVHTNHQEPNYTNPTLISFYSPHLPINSMSRLYNSCTHWGQSVAAI